MPKSTNLKPERNAYCYNCAKKGHYGHNCTKARFNQSTVPVTLSVFKYEPFIIENSQFPSQNFKENHQVPPNTKENDYNSQINRLKCRVSTFWFEFLNLILIFRFLVT